MNRKAKRVGKQLNNYIMANGAKKGVLLKMELNKISEEISNLVKEIENDITIGTEIPETISGQLKMLSEIKKNTSENKQ